MTNDPMTHPLDLTALAALHEKATKGEWGHASDAKSGYIQSDALDSFKAPWAYYPEATVAMFPRHPVDRIADTILCVELHNQFPALLAYVRRLEKVAEAARKGPCRHDSSHTGVDGCPTCAALSRLSQEVKGE